MKNFSILFLICLSLTVQAQTAINDRQQTLLGQGRINLGVSTGFGYAGYIGNSYHVAPRVQYFLKDGWSVALDARYDANDGSQTKFWGGGLSTRYYFVRGQRVALFAQAGAMYGRTKYYTDYASPSPQQFGSPQYANTLQTHAGLGIHYRLGKRWSLEGLAERMLTNSGRPALDASQWRTSIGINFRIK
ncbi:hypothetical protein [Fibrisoma limi]|uniref:hypothetical protein n=1 Tax=Fibrisoma limi TaxID=663275 RepID=UPI0002D99FC1|nr:hypothetical protein [Fibrisoma limi]